MASTFTSMLGLEKPGAGDQNNTWGGTINANMDRIDAATPWQVLSSQLITTAGLTEVRFALQGNTYFHHRIEWQDFGPVSTGIMAASVSTDNGATILSGGSDYVQLRNSQVGNSAPASTYITTGYVSLSPSLIGGTFGSMDVYPGSRYLITRMWGSSTGGLVRQETLATAGTVNALLTTVILNFSGQTIRTGGRVRLLGAVN